MNTLSSEWHTRIRSVKRECTALGSEPDHGSRGSEANFSTDFQEEKADSIRYSDGRNGTRRPLRDIRFPLRGFLSQTSPQGEGARAGVAARYDTAWALRNVTSLDLANRSSSHGVKISSNSWGQFSRTIEMGDILKVV